MTGGKVTGGNVTGGNVMGGKVTEGNSPTSIYKYVFLTFLVVLNNGALTEKNTQKVIHLSLMHSYLESFFYGITCYIAAANDVG